MNPDIIARTPWFRYSPSTDTLYCCYCLLFITHDRSFRTRDWSNISKLVKKHVCEKSAHHTAVARGKAFLHTQQGGASVNSFTLKEQNKLEEIELFSSV